MIEKIIFDGYIEGSKLEIEEIINIFIQERLSPEDLLKRGYHFNIDLIDSKQVWLVHPKSELDLPKVKATLGYVEINPVYISEEKPVRFRLISCQEPYNLLFFELSQRIQAKFILQNIPYARLETPWQEFLSQGLINFLPNEDEELLLDNSFDPKEELPKYGTDRDLSKKEVTLFVKKCRAYMTAGGTKRQFYEETLSSETKDKFAFETLRDWMNDPKFKPPSRTKNSS